MVYNFARASTGLNGLDEILDYLRMGDNVVWQVNSVEDYAHFVQPFIIQAQADNRKIIYMRFGKHAEIVRNHPDIKVYQLDAGQGFETFSASVHNIASAEGEGVFYVFDCLSDLLSAWATDLMIGNFFKVTCPYLFELGTIAYFAIFRDCNSYDTIARIRETTQLLLNVYRFDSQYFIHPLKVWNRYSPTMFLPHMEVEDKYLPITSSAESSRLFSSFQDVGPGNVGLKLDYWDRVFLNARELIERTWEDDLTTAPEQAEMLEQLCRMMLGCDERFLSLARKYFMLSDLLEIHNRLLGSGFIGGKSLGMLLARKILKSSGWDWDSLLEVHDSFYIGSDVYYTYLVENDCWKLRLEQKKMDCYYSAAEKLRERILNGVIPANIREQFCRMLEYYGQSPIIVRSSSLLEDGFGNAFAGKYESIFCVNQGNLEERYDCFEKAVKTIFASTMSKDALTYRLQRGLAASDEQMALLVQRVSGSYHEHYFFPHLAGVAMSHNPYIWRADMDSRAGMMRLVMGLGTRAVDRMEDDYPRLVALDRPLLRTVSTPEDLRRYSQHEVDVLDIQTNKWVSVSLAEIASLNPAIPCWNLAAQRDHTAIRRMQELGSSDPTAWVLTFDRLLTDTSLVSVMTEMLQTLEDAYAYPVDTEFTVNYLDDNKMQLNLVQCRPLQTIQYAGKSLLPSGTSLKKRLFSTRGNFMGSEVSLIKKIIYVQPEAYIQLPLADKYQIARLIGKLNRLFAAHPSSDLMLIGPGRWGTSTPSLGIPVSFSEICNISVLVEVAYKEAGYVPELSYGTHFFQDLVEMQIFYVALFPGEDQVEFYPQFLNDATNLFAQFLPEYSRWQEIIKVIDLDHSGQGLYLDLDLEERQVIAYLIEE